MKIKKILFRLISTALIITWICCLRPEETRANNDWSFNDPIAFYDQMLANNKIGKFICTNGNIYFANKSKLAASTTKWRYVTIGYSINVSSSTYNGSITIDVAKDYDGGANTNNCTAYTHKSTPKNGYYYGIEVIPYSEIIAQCSVKNPTATKEIFKADKINIIINPIMTSKLYGAVQGGITENKDISGAKKGTVTNTPAVSNGRNYYLRNTTDYNDFNAFFKSFDEQKLGKITGIADNFYLSLSYNLNGGELTDASPYTINSDGTVNFGNDSTYTKVYTIGQIKLPTIGDICFTKKGYHLIEGKEWIYKNNNAFTAGKVYYSGDIDGDVKRKNTSGTFTANWEANTYTVKFDANGGSGSMNDDTVSYDANYYVPQNTFSKVGHDFAGWRVYVNNDALVSENYVLDTSMYKDGKFIYGNNNQLIVKNLSSDDGAIVTFEAQWTPKIYQISLHKGLSLTEAENDISTNMFYSTYEKYFSLLGTEGSQITTITLPTKNGYDFVGYYENLAGTGDTFVVPTKNNIGTINFSPSYFTSSATLYAKWKTKTIKLNFDANTVETNSTIIGASQLYLAEYGKPLPIPLTPSVNGYAFKGFFTEKDGKGTCYYTPYMAPTVSISKFTTDTTLYAYWVDEVKPIITIETESSGWTNSNDNTDMGQTDDGYKITFSCTEKGSGVAKIEIYRQNNAGVFELVKTATNVDEAQYTETEEGVIRYKAIATDKSGNVSSEKYCTIYYDKSSPRILAESNGDTNDFSNISGEIYATDYQN